MPLNWLGNRGRASSLLGENGRKCTGQISWNWQRARSGQPRERLAPLEYVVAIRPSAVPQMERRHLHLAGRLRYDALTIRAVYFSECRCLRTATASITAGRIQTTVDPRRE